MVATECGAQFEAHQYESPWWQAIPLAPHAVLTYEYERAHDAGPEHPTRRAFVTLVGFLNKRLRPTAAADGN